MTTRTNHGAEIHLDTEGKMRTIRGMKWRGKDGRHAIGLADYGDGSTVIVAELNGARTLMRLTPPSTKILAALLMKRMEGMQ